MGGVPLLFPSIMIRLYIRSTPISSMCLLLALKIWDRGDITMTSKQKKRIGCLGSGRLYQAVQSYLEQEYELLDIEGIGELASQVPGCSMILYCDDQWHFQMQHQINQQCLRFRIPWLRAYCEFGTGIIRPCVNPEEAGCVACVELRRRAAIRDATD